MADNDVPGWDLCGPKCTIGRLYNENYYTLLRTKYESSGPCSFRDDFYVVVFFLTIVSSFD